MNVILGCGDRHWKDYKKIYNWLYHYHKRDPVTFVLAGGASGADTLIKKAAMALGIQSVELAANWYFFKQSAGPIRNSMQLKLLLALHKYNSIMVLAFHSDIKNSKGTKNMVKQAKKAGVKVRIIK